MTFIAEKIRGFWSGYTPITVKETTETEEKTTNVAKSGLKCIPEEPEWATPPTQRRSYAEVVKAPIPEKDQT